MEPITFELADSTILLNKWQRLHWAARRKHVSDLSWLVLDAMKGMVPPEPWPKCRVTVERRSIRLPDWDGLYGGLKPLLDCLVRRTDRNPHGLGVIEDDNPECIVELRAIPIRVRKRAEQGTRVVIEWVD